MRKLLIDKKGQFFPQAKTPEEDLRRSETMVNLLYSFASNKPNNFGVYKVYAAEEINELLSHYEEDLKSIAGSS